MSMSSKRACCEHTLVSSSLRTRLFFTAWATLATEALLRTPLLSRTLSNMLPAFLAPTSTWIVDVSALRQHSIHLLLDDRGVASRVHNHAQEDPVNHGIFSSSFLSPDKHWENPHNHIPVVTALEPFHVMLGTRHATALESSGPTRASTPYNRFCPSTAGLFFV